jgi:hypothetical protein
MRMSNTAWIAPALLLMVVAGCDQQNPAAPAAPVAEATPTPAAPPAATPEQVNTKFETWTLIGSAVVKDAAATAPDGSQTADVLELKNGDGVAYTDSNVGPEVSASVMLWGQEGQHLSLQLVNWCRSDPSQVETLQIALTATPTEYSLKKKFPQPEDCVRFQIVMTDISGVVNAWNPRVERIAAPATTPAP